MTKSSDERDTQLKYLQVIRKAAEDSEPRVDGYNQALLDAVIDVVALEAQHAQQSTNIVQKATAAVEALGRHLTTGGWSEVEESSK